MNIALQILLFVFAFLQSKPEATLKLSFVDQSGQPVQVTIDEQNSEPTAGYASVPHLRESNIDGEIDVVVDEKNTEQCCFVFAKGFAIDLLSTSFSNLRTMRITMQPESDIAVLIVDRKGKPIANARVTPGNTHFRRSAWIANVPHRLPRDFESQTDANGQAKMRGTIADQLRSIRISVEDKPGCTFQIPERWDRTSALRVVWDGAFGTLVCRVVDPNGNPVAGAKLYANTNEEFLNENVIREPTRNFIDFLGETGKDGCVTIENVPAIPIDVRVFSPQKTIGRGEYRKEFVIEAEKTNLLEFRQKPVFNCLVSVVDVTDSQTYKGIAVQFELRDRLDNIRGSAKTNEDGLCEMAVQPGDWQFNIDESTLPDGYCIYYPERSTKFTVVQSSEHQTAPPVYIGKGLLIQGNIVGLDMRELRFDWISAAPKDAANQWMGRINERGEFRMFVPNYIDLESVIDFSIGDSGQVNLAVESKSPWVLKM